jgi:hypothetical protein
VRSRSRCGGSKRARSAFYWHGGWSKVRITRNSNALRVRTAAGKGTTPVSLLERAGVAADALDSAVVADVIERENGMIRFTHPLLSSVLYADLGEKLGVHARIAEIVEDPVLAARHIALSTDTPNADVARLLDDAATVANDRGASAVTAELAEQALRLTPPDRGDDRRRRALAAARAHLAAGEWTRARTIATDLLAETEAGPLRAEVLLLLAEFEHDDLAVPVLAEALREASSDPPLQARIRVRLAYAERFRKGFAAALEGTRVALELADRLDDDIVRFEALVQLHMLGATVGDAETPAYALRARDLATATGDARLVRKGNVLVSAMLFDSGSIDARRAVLEREYREWQERDELFSAQVLWDLAWLELWAGRWELAGEHAARARDVRAQYGVERNQDYIPITWIAAHRGQLELAWGGVRASPEALRGADRVPSAPARGRTWTRRALARRCGDGCRTARQGRSEGESSRVGCTGRAAMDCRLRGGAPRARQGRPGGTSDRRLGNGCGAARQGPGARTRNPLPRARGCSARRCRRGSVVARAAVSDR